MNKVFKHVLSSTNIRQISSSPVLCFPTKHRNKPNYPLTHQRLAQRKLIWKIYSDVKIAQKKRLKWEYPVMPDQRSTWKHRRWYDVFLNRWIDTMPSGIIPKHANYYKRNREHIFQAETPNEFNLMLLDRFNYKKYVIHSFNHESPVSNISYYFQYLTHTKYVHGLPCSIHNASVDEEVLAKFREFVKEVLLLHHNLPSDKHQEDPLQRAHKTNTSCLRAMFSYLLSALSLENPSLSNCEVDHNAENASFWLRGQNFLKWTLPDDLNTSHQCHDPVLMQVCERSKKLTHLSLQHTRRVLFTFLIRTKEQLPAFSPYSGQFSTSGEIPSFYTSPHVFAIEQKQYRNTMNPGYRLFAGDINQNYQYAKDEEMLEQLPPPTYNECKYGHTQLVMLPETYSRDWYKDSLEHCDITSEIDEHLKGRGIMSGWVWNSAQAHYAQRWMDHDIDSPFCSQSVVTDGQWLSFFCYQLNTIAIDAENVENHQKRNICFGKPSVKLYDEITPTEVVGLNDEALTLMVKFIKNGQQLPIISDQDLETYNSTLHVQEVDPERPEIELQKPLHKAEILKQKQLIEEARKLEEEKNKSLKTRLKDIFQ